jgi:hypothetical protein
MPLLYEALPFVVGYALALSLDLDNIDVHGIQIALSLRALVCTMWLETSWGVSLSLAAISLLHAKCGCKASSKGSAAVELIKHLFFDPRGIVLACHSLPFNHHLQVRPLFIKYRVVECFLKATSVGDNCSEGILFEAGKGHDIIEHRSISVKVISLHL